MEKKEALPGVCGSSKLWWLRVLALGPCKLKAFLFEGLIDCMLKTGR